MIYESLPGNSRYKYFRYTFYDSYRFFIKSLSPPDNLYKTFIKSSATLYCKFLSNESYKLGYYWNYHFGIDVSYHPG